MKVSLNWLTDYVDVGAVSAAELGEVFTHIGFCCDEVAQTDSDVVFDLEITNNRPDCLGHIGLARELAAALNLELKTPDLAGVAATGPDVAGLTSVEVRDADLCPRYAARVIRGVKIGPSPAWLVERLEAVGLRSINNVVDVTNYVLLEYSQPLHAFDQDLLAEGRIVVRRAADGEVMKSIDETTCKLTGEMLVIADAAAPVAIAGIMGGLTSEVQAETTNILLESAQFDQLATRRTARALALMSESSYRFERGVDPVGVERASLRACQLIMDTAGGELAAGIVDVWAQPHEPQKVTLRTDRCRKLLGVDIDDATQLEILARLDLAPAADDGEIVCTIPSFRSDLKREVDLIEEIARLHGYDKIPTHAKVTHSVVGMSDDERATRALREVLSAAGFDEAITFTFVDDAEAALFGFEGGVRVDARIRRTNNLLRPCLAPSLLRACKSNQDVGASDVSLYELAAVFPAGDSAEGLPDEYVQLALATQGELRMLRGVLESAVARVVPRAKLEIVPGEVIGLADGASATVVLDGEPAGVMGLAAPAVLDHYGLEKPHALAAINFDMLLARPGEAKTYRPLPRFPAIRRDLSVVVPAATSWGQLAEVIGAVAQDCLEAVEYVGEYVGKQVGRGERSVTFSLVYRSAEGTLRHEEVDEMVAAVLAALAEKLSTTLRT